MKFNKFGVAILKILHLAILWLENCQKSLHHICKTPYREAKFQDPSILAVQMNVPFVTCQYYDLKVFLRSVFTGKS